jgi:hypothetical protein
MEPSQHHTSHILPSAYELLKKSLDLYIKNYKFFALIGCIPALFGVLPLILDLSLQSSRLESAAGLNYQTISVIIGLISIVGAFQIFSFVLLFISQIALMKGTKDAAHGKTTSVNELYHFGVQHFFSYFWVNILVVFAWLGGLVLFVIPGFIIVGYTIFALWCVVLLRERGIQALTTSYYLVKNKWWNVFFKVFYIGIFTVCIYILYYVCIGSPLYIAGAKDVFDSSATTALGTLLSIGEIFLTNLIVLPVACGFMYYLFTALVASKNLPVPHHVLEKGNKWFTGLSIFGLISPLLLALLVFVVSVVGVLMLGKF